VSESQERVILIVEDEVAIRAALAESLRLDGHRVVEAGTLAEGRALLAAQLPDLVLLDVRLPDGNGLELLREIRARGAEVPVLVLTARGAEEDRVLGFEHGCDDYVVKPFSLRELKLRMAALLRRRAPAALPCTRLQIGAASVDLAAYRVHRDGRELSLSPKERDLLALLVEHPGVVISRQRFLNEVWGYERYPTTRTVDMHVMKLRQKLELDPDHPRHLITVHGAGYRYDP
jgi:two-component system alkaline phosphatase synthesis response regulator PhoP